MLSQYNTVNGVAAAYDAFVFYVIFDSKHITKFLTV